MDRKLTSFSPAGAVITAILASVCCVGPLVLVILGVSGAWIGGLRALEAYRPLFNLLTVGFLAAGFYRVYSKPSGNCKAGHCDISGRKRLKAVLWVATIFAVFLLM